MTVPIITARRVMMAPDAAPAATLLLRLFLVPVLSSRFFFFFGNTGSLSSAGDRATAVKSFLLGLFFLRSAFSFVIGLPSPPGDGDLMAITASACFMACRCVFTL